MASRLEIANDDGSEEEEKESLVLKKKDERETDVAPGACSHESKCPICLEDYDDKAFVDKCFHAFCYVCILQWSEVSNKCPLCKVNFRSLIHSVVSNSEYKTHVLKPPVSRSSSHEVSINEARRRFRYRTTVVLPGERQPHEGQRHRLAQSRKPATIERRKTVYQSGMRALPLVTENKKMRVRDITATFFQSNPAATHRLLPWLSRDIKVLLGEEHVEFIIQMILSLIDKIDLESKQFQDHMRPFFGHQTEHFFHEFISFAKSPLDMTAYDHRVSYGLPKRKEKIEEDKSQLSNEPGPSGVTSQIVSNSNQLQTTTQHQSPSYTDDIQERVLYELATTSWDASPIMLHDHTPLTPTHEDAPIIISSNEDESTSTNQLPIKDLQVNEVSSCSMTMLIEREEKYKTKTGKKKETRGRKKEGTHKRKTKSTSSSSTKTKRGKERGKEKGKERDNNYTSIERGTKYSKDKRKKHHRRDRYYTDTDTSYSSNGSYYSSDQDSDYERRRHYHRKSPYYKRREDRSDSESSDVESYKERSEYNKRKRRSHDYDKRSHDYKSHDYDKRSHDYKSHDYDKRSHDYKSHDYDKRSHDYKKRSHDYKKRSHDQSHNKGHRHSIRHDSSNLENFQNDTNESINSELQLINDDLIEMKRQILKDSLRKERTQLLKRSLKNELTLATQSEDKTTPTFEEACPSSDEGINNDLVSELKQIEETIKEKKKQIIAVAKKIELATKEDHIYSDSD